VSQTAEPIHNAHAVAGLTRMVGALAATGIDWIQIREKDLPPNELAALTRSALASAGAFYMKGRQFTGIFVNDDTLDTVLATRPFGVQLSEKASLADALERLEAYQVRRGLFVGKSCHTLEFAVAAEREGADYIFFGPVYATPSKAAFGPPQGLARLAEVCRAVSIPVLAIGGITEANFIECLHAGAAGIAAIRMFQDAADPAATIQALRKLAK
jgi:thiamine-phosphate pyrophosphorylase